MDGALGNNNPIFTLWSQAQDVWGAKKMQEDLKCLVSIGTGVPPLQHIPNDVLHISEALAKIATETEDTAEKFHQHAPELGDDGRYFRFNVAQGLEDIGLEEWQKSSQIAAATALYLGTQVVSKQVRDCANRLTQGE